MIVTLALSPLACRSDVCAIDVNPEAGSYQAESARPARLTGARVLMSGDRVQIRVTRPDGTRLKVRYRVVDAFE